MSTTSDARRMDGQLRGENQSNKQYAEQIQNESEKLDELVSQVRKAMEDGTISGLLISSKIMRATGCTVVTAEKVKAIIKGE